MDLASEIERNVASALAEDMGGGDVTAPLTPAGKPARAGVLCRVAPDPGVHVVGDERWL